MNDFYANIAGSGHWWNYQLLKDNEAWRFVVILGVIIITLAVGKISQFILGGLAQKRKNKVGSNTITIFLKSISKPSNVAFLGIGLFICRSLVVFANPENPESAGLDAAIGANWTKISLAVIAIAVAYAFYSLVDLVEYHLLKLTSRTATKLDDMLVPVVRKSLKITIAIISALWIADGILELQIRAIIVSAGVGGIAIALAAKDTVANFFGSITIFADRPFQVDELIEVQGYIGTVEEVGFRSTRIRTFDGHLVAVPNSIIANTVVKNISQRPFIRRVTNITITYDSGIAKTEKAIQIIKEVLAAVPEINTDPDRPTRVYFDDFASCSLKIYLAYWVKPPDFWVFKEVNDKINFEILKRFDAEGIDFAFPSQTLYVKKDQ